MDTLHLKLNGTQPLLMHSDTGANPLHPLTKAHKELTTKRKKTDEDHEGIAKSEWLMSLYYNKEFGIYVPGINVESCLVAGAKLSKLGTAVKRGVSIVETYCPLIYTGPKDPEGLWKAGFYDARSVKVQQARLMRYRPMFETWAIEVQVAYDSEVINTSEVLKSMTDAGAFIGLGDFRPRFGRFEVEVLK